MRKSMRFLFCASTAALILGAAPIGVGIKLGWSARSRFAAIYRRAGGTRANLARLLAIPNLRIARTDPRLDPKGVYTIAAVREMLGPARERALLGSDDNAAQIFPEESLLVHLESGEADVGFVYETEAIAHHLQIAPLPGVHFAVRYRIAILKKARHPDAANEFVDFVERGEGRVILERYGVEKP
jgi:molybdate/tungstate transport system substrate-binding protein